jgi:hypothetical protein
MSNLNLELDFVDDRKSKLPHPSRPHVQVKLSTGNGYISQTCMTVSEFDGEIDRLIKKLKSIQSGGHARVAAEYKREGTHKAPTT